MIIRQATAADSPAIVKLERRTASAAHWSDEQYSKIFSGMAAKRLVLVAVEDDLIVGFVVALTVSPEWEIENVAVSQSVQRRGFGTELVSRLLQEARRSGAQAALLEVRVSNQPAHRLYEKLGLQKNGERTRYYKDPQEDAVLYRIDFT